MIYVSNCILQKTLDVYYHGHKISLLDIYIYIYIHIYIYTHTHTHIYIYIYMQIKPSFQPNEHWPLVNINSLLKLPHPSTPTRHNKQKM
jgi:hypothetical protein